MQSFQIEFVAYARWCKPQPFQSENVPSTPIPIAVELLQCFRTRHLSTFNAYTNSRHCRTMHLCNYYAYTNSRTMHLFTSAIICRREICNCAGIHFIRGSRIMGAQLTAILYIPMIAMEKIASKSIRLHSFLFDKNIF